MIQEYILIHIVHLVLCCWRFTDRGNAATSLSHAEHVVLFSSVTECVCVSQTSQQKCPWSLLQRTQQRYDASMRSNTLIRVSRYMTSAGTRFWTISCPYGSKTYRGRWVGGRRENFAAESPGMGSCRETLFHSSSTLCYSRNAGAFVTLTTTDSDYKLEANFI